MVQFQTDNWLTEVKVGMVGWMVICLYTHTQIHIHQIPGTCECYHIPIKVSLQMKLQIVRWDHPRLTGWVLIWWFCCSVWFFATLWTAARLIQWQMSLQETHTGDTQGKMIQRRRQGLKWCRHKPRNIWSHRKPNRQGRIPPRASGGPAALHTPCELAVPSTHWSQFLSEQPSPRDSGSQEWLHPHPAGVGLSKPGCY